MLIKMKPSFHFILQFFYMWKKDKKSLMDMKEKDKEQLLEVRLRSTFHIIKRFNVSLPIKRFKMESSNVWFCISGFRRIFVEPPSLCLTLRAFCIWRKMARNPGNSATSYFGPLDCITHPKARQRSAQATQTVKHAVHFEFRQIPLISLNVHQFTFW